MGNSLNDLKAFPADARREAGYQVDRVQNGLLPADWKPMATIGAGVSEIRIRTQSGAFRVIYVARTSHAIYVLHCFRKTTQKTSLHDLRLAQQRFKQMDTTP